MITLPCPRCGTKDTNGTFCTACRSALEPLVAKMKTGKLTLCANCDRIKQHGAWKTIPRERAIEDALSQTITFSEGTTVTEIHVGEAEFLKNPGIKRTIDVPIVIVGKRGDAKDPYEEEYEAPIAYEVRLCEACRKGGSYYEGILQLRNPHPQAITFIDEYLRRNVRKGINLAKRVEAKNGCDLYLSSHRAVGHLARQIHQEFGGELKINAQHFSESKQEGRILYRTNALVELPTYTKGHVIRRNDTLYYIIGISHTVKAENIKTGEIETFTYHGDDAAVLVDAKTNVVSVDPLELTHPTTYAQTSPLRSKFAPTDLEIGQEVHVAIERDTLILIP